MPMHSRKNGIAYKIGGMTFKRKLALGEVNPTVGYRFVQPSDARQTIAAGDLRSTIIGHSFFADKSPMN